MSLSITSLTHSRRRRIFQNDESKDIRHLMDLSSNFSFVNLVLFTIAAVLLCVFLVGIIADRGFVIALGWVIIIERRRYIAQLLAVLLCAFLLDRKFDLPASGRGNPTWLYTFTQFIIGHGPGVPPNRG